tara:strand:- start:439 stop:1119 length:681 start_codon:yes stop_codon:yes gene_type:complete
MPNEPKYFRKFDYNRNLIPNSFLADLDKVKNLDEAKEKTGFSIGYPGWGLLYYSTMCALNPHLENHIIETGTNFGSSTIILAQALKDSGFSGHVDTIEIDTDTAKQAEQNISLSGTSDFITQHTGDAKQKLAEVLQEIPNIQVAFLDGSHLFDDVVTEFELVLPKINDDGIVVFDNTYQIASEEEDQRVYGALSFIINKWGGNLINFPTVSWYTPGMAIWQKHPLM